MQDERLIRINKSVTNERRKKINISNQEEQSLRTLCLGSFII